MIFSTEKEKNLGQIIPNMTVSTWLVRSTDKELISGMTDQNIQENGLRIK